MGKELATECISVVPCQWTYLHKQWWQEWPVTLLLTGVFVEYAKPQTESVLGANAVIEELDFQQVQGRAAA